MQRVFLDFESRSSQPIKFGTSNYADHESTHLLCMAWAIDEGPVSLWTPGRPLPDWIWEIQQNPTLELHAHNARFERLMWPRTWPRPRLNQWYCTAAKAAAAGLPRALDKAAAALGLSMRKDKEGKALIRKLCVPRKATKGNAAEYNDDAAEMVKLFDYCCQDVEVERAIDKALPDWPARERMTYWLDQLINDRGFEVDLELVECVLRLFDDYERTLKRELKKVTGGAVTSGSQVARFVQWLDAEGVSVGDLRALTVLRVLADETTPPAPRRACEIRAQLAKASVKKYLAFRNWASADHRLRGGHLYFGAGTGRWAGQGIQCHNFPRGTLAAPEKEEGAKNAYIDAAVDTVRLGLRGMADVWGDVAGALSSLLRPMIVAKPGHVLTVVDFAAVEARVLAWLAGQSDLVEAYRNGVDTYVSLASQIYKVAPEEVTKAQRQVGKIARLGLGYQMGWSKFQATAAQFEILLDDQFCQTVVDTYRSQSGKIKSFWYDLERAAIACTESKKSRRCGPITFYRTKRWLMARLPSGRNIPYFMPTVSGVRTEWGDKRLLSYLTVNSQTRQFKREMTYGGKLAENIVQGTCRDLLVDAMLRLENAKCPVVLHVHDEVVTETPIGFVTTEQVEKIVAAVPKWATGCPIGVEGFQSNRYRK
jgi:DNA polymerase